MLLNTFILASAEGSAHAGFEAQAKQLGLNLPGLFAQMVVFTILAFALKKYAFDPIMIVLEERRKEIAASLENADRIKKELADAEVSRKEIMKKAQDQATQMIAEAHKAAAAQGEKKLQEAIAEAENILKKGREGIALDREKMLAELRKEIVGLVIETTAKVSGKVLSADDQNRLKDETVKQLVA